MGPRCFLFTSDGPTAEMIRQILAGLEMQAESCPEATVAVEQISQQSFQIVIIDWEQQPEAPLLLGAARDRKASERPITLAIVADDRSVPKALQAGANSILRRPISANQAKDTLKTARDLLRARREPSAQAAATPRAASAVAAASASSLPSSPRPGSEPTLRAGEFLQSTPTAPQALFETESGLPASLDAPVNAPVDPLKDLEPVAASVDEKPAPVAAPAPDEPRGLDWYLKSRPRQPFYTQPPAPPKEKESSGPDLLSYDQIQAATPSTASVSVETPELPPSPPPSSSEQKKEAELFAYMDGESKSEEVRPRRRLGRSAIIGALVLAGLAICAAPQAPWHPQVRVLWSRGQRALHAWLNPQPVTPTQAPAAHEDFARAGDEYKLPATEAIPDATTDPSQIQVLPVVDPTAKKANGDGAASDQPAVTDGSGTPAANPSAPSVISSTTPPVAPGVAEPTATPAAVPAVVPVTPPPVTTHTEPPAASRPATAAPVVQPAPPPARQPMVPGNIPSSLKSQMASSTPDASGNKPIDSAMPSIEPVSVQEAAERALLADQPAISYPDAAKGQQGTVVLQVIVGRDGTVQDAKFLQGSLAFARAAIDGVRQWKFKPFQMNGRPVSVQTSMTITFKPGSSQ